MGKNVITRGTAVAGRYQGIEVGIPYYEKVPFAAPGTTAETDSGYDLPEKALVTDIFVDVTTASSAASVLDVGLLASSSGGDLDGLIDGLAVTATGLNVPVLTATTDGQYDAATYGPFLATGLVGSTSYALTRRNHISDSVTAKSLTYTINSSSADCVGNIFIGLVNLYSSE